MGSTVDGLVSGMDTTSMIASMMKIESQPKTLLQNKVSTAQYAVGSYQSVNSKLSALKNAADDLSQLSTWRAVKPTTTSSSVTAIATGGTSTQTGTLTFDVVSVAKAQAATTRVAAAGDITTAAQFQIQIGSAAPVTITLGADKSAQAVSDAINSAGIGVKSSAVQTNAGDTVLQLTGSATGAANAFTVSGLTTASGPDLAFATTTPASDALIQVGGPDASGGYGVSSATNTFTGLMNGVSLTVGKEETGVTLSVAQDVSGIAAKFKALVDAANATLTEVGNQTKYDSGTNTASPLTGDFMVRQLSQSILSAVSRGLSYDDNTLDANGDVTSTTHVDFGTLSKFGVQLDKTGQLTFKESAFTAAYNKDPNGITKAGMAFADQFEALAKTQSDTVTSAITSRNNQIESLNSQIDNWDVRLAARQDALSKQYAGLETALGKLKNQSTWLSGQLAGLS
jgi:flagellar hook-associated protein 2